MKKVSFTEMKHGTKEDYLFLDKHEKKYAGETAERILKFMSGLNETLEGYQVSRLEHSLQSATKALKNGETEEMVVAALLHDIGDELAPMNHSEYAAAILKLYSKPAIVVDFGTATVFDAISEEGQYIGGSIVPGIAVSADALYHGTSQLRRVDLKIPDKVIGKNTINALQSGLIVGHISMVEGMIARFKQEFTGNPVVVATGGFAELINQNTNVFDYVDKDISTPEIEHLATRLDYFLSDLETPRRERVTERLKTRVNYLGLHLNQISFH